MDAVLGLNVVNEDSAIDETELGLYRLITIQWAPIQFVTVFGVLLYVSLSGHLGAGLFVCGCWGCRRHDWHRLQP